jgi:hypothetical protein
MCPEMSVINYTVVKFLKINIKNHIIYKILIKFCIENIYQQVRQYQKSITHGHTLCYCPQILCLTKNFKKNTGNASTWAIPKVLSELTSQSRKYENATHQICGLYSLLYKIPTLINAFLSPFWKYGDPLPSELCFSSS